MGSLCTFGLEFGFMLAAQPPKLSSLLQRYKQAAMIITPFTVVLALILSWHYTLESFDTIAIIIIAVAEVLTIIFLPVNLQYRSVVRFGFIRISRRAILFFFILFLSLIISSGQISLSFGLQIHAFAWLFSAIFSIAGIKGLKNRGGEEAEKLTVLWIKGAGIFFAKYAERAQPRIGLIILGMANMAKEAAYFAVASLVIDLSIFISSSVSIGILTKQGGVSLIAGKMLLRICLIVIAMNCAVGVAIWFFIEPVLIFIYGDLYLPVANIVRILTPILAVYGAYPLLSMYLIKINQTKSVIFGNYLALILNVVIAIILLKQGFFSGGQAAAIALAIGLLSNSAIGGFVAVKARKNRHASCLETEMENDEANNL